MKQELCCIFSLHFFDIYIFLLFMTDSVYVENVWSLAWSRKKLGKWMHTYAHTVSTMLWYNTVEVDMDRYVFFPFFQPSMYIVYAYGQENERSRRRKWGKGPNVPLRSMHDIRKRQGTGSTWIRLFVPLCASDEKASANDFCFHLPALSARVKVYYQLLLGQKVTVSGYLK